MQEENYSKILSFPFPAIKYPPVYLSTDGYFFIQTYTDKVSKSKVYWKRDTLNTDAPLFFRRLGTSFQYTYFAPIIFSICSYILSINQHTITNNMEITIPYKRKKK